jgi:hypothetical protein
MVLLWQHYAGTAAQQGMEHIISLRMGNWRLKDETISIYHHADIIDLLDY